MAICPSCKNEIEYLTTYTEKNAIIQLDKQNKVIYLEDSNTETQNPFFCPECNEKLFFSEEGAIHFLKKK